VRSICKHAELRDVPIKFYVWTFQHFENVFKIKFKIQEHMLPGAKTPLPHSAFWRPQHSGIDIISICYTMHVFVMQVVDLFWEPSTYNLCINPAVDKCKAGTMASGSGCVHTSWNCRKKTPILSSGSIGSQHRAGHSVRQANGMVDDV
jgi:hypothetical protein